MELCHQSEFIQQLHFLMFEVVDIILFTRFRSIISGLSRYLFTIDYSGRCQVLR